MASIHPEEHRGGKRTWRVKVTAAEKQIGYPGKSFPRKSEAQLYVAQVTARVRSAAKSPETTLAELIERRRSTRSASRSTLAKEASLTKRLAPLADRQVAALRPSDVRAYVKSLEDAGLAAETISAILRLLRSTLDLAVEDELVVANVAARVKAPRIVKPRLDADDVLTIEQAEAVLSEIPNRYRALFAVKMYAATRLNEVLAMTRSDADLLRRRIHVGAVVLEEVAGVAELREVGKTRNSDRWTRIPPRVVELLEHHLATYRPGRDGLIFTTASGSYVLRDALRRRVWLPALARATWNAEQAARKAAGDTGTDPEEVSAFAVSMRNLRHSGVTWMLSSGRPAVEVAKEVGHAKPSMTTDVYARFIPDEDRDDPYDALVTGTLGKLDHDQRRNSGGTLGSIHSG